MFSQSTVYDDLHSLRQTALVEIREEGHERHYRAEPFKVGIITAGEPQLTMITPRSSPPSVSKSTTMSRNSSKNTVSNG